MLGAFRGPDNHRDFFGNNRLPAPDLHPQGTALSSSGFNDASSCPSPWVGDNKSTQNAPSQGQ